MSRQYYNLPSLNALATFEAVARHQSLTLAAAELGVTAGAVSRQIKILESELGIQLLNRAHKKIEVNKNGKVLSDSIKHAFTNINKTVSKFSDPSLNLTFSLASTTAFSSLWLMPRLSRFWKQHPEIRINHILSDNTLEKSYDSADISIQYDLGNRSQQHAKLLFNDEIYPVCSPELAHKFIHVESPEQLTSLPLLQLNHADKSWTDWYQWLKHFDVEAKLPKVNSFNNYIIALQAAQDSQGVLLGWDKLVSPLIKDKKLKRMLDVSYQSPGSYYMYWPTDRIVNIGARTFIDWFSDQANID